MWLYGHQGRGRGISTEQWISALGSATPLLRALGCHKPAVSAAVWIPIPVWGWDLVAFTGSVLLLGLLLTSSAGWGSDFTDRKSTL